MKTEIRMTILAFACVPHLAGAHHSASARYDRDKIVEISGTVVQVRWDNPHVEIVITASDGQEWVAEGIGRTYMKQRGIGPEMFPLGGHVILAGLASRFDLPEMFMGNMLLGDGTELLLAGGAAPRWTSEQSEAEPGI